MNNVEIGISERAFNSIGKILDFVKNVSPISANNLKDEISVSIDSLKHFPERYPSIDISINGKIIRKMPIANGRYQIIYAFKDSKILIYDVIDCRKENALDRALKRV